MSEYVAVLPRSSLTQTQSHRYASWAPLSRFNKMPEIEHRQYKHKQRLESMTNHTWLMKLDHKWTDKSQPFDTQIFVTIITVYIVPWSRTTMARATKDSISEEKGFAKCVSTLFYITKFSGIVPFDLFIYKRSKAFVLSTIGTWLSIGCATFYLSYYNYLLARMYFTLPISAIGKSIHHILLHCNIFKLCGHRKPAKFSKF